MPHYTFRVGVSVLLATICMPLTSCYCQPAFSRPGVTHEYHKTSGGSHGNPGSMSPIEVRELLDQAGGKIVSFANGFYFLEWFPENWNSFKAKYIVISLHGSGGHAEQMFNLWYRNRCYHDYAIIAPQYAVYDEQGNARFHDCREIYRNLKLIIDHLKKSDLYSNKDLLILHGFSMGAARIFELAALDRADNGMHIFNAFIVDSGTSLAESKGILSPFLSKLTYNAYDGARFWLYSGSGDHGGRTYADMRKMRKFITEHGGKVDDLFVYDTNLHGILITGGPKRESAALNALFAYIESIKLTPE